MPASINSRRAARRSLTLTIFLDILRGALGAVGRTMHATQIQPLDQLGRDLMDTEGPVGRPVSGSKVGMVKPSRRTTPTDFNAPEIKLSADMPTSSRTYSPVAPEGPVPPSLTARRLLSGTFARYITPASGVHPAITSALQAWSRRGRLAETCSRS